MADGGILRILTDGGSAADRAVWTEADLTPTGQRGTARAVELWVGADNVLHAVGDPTWRDEQGRLHDRNGFAVDPNKPVPAHVQAPAIRVGDQIIPTDGDEPSAVALRQAVADRDAASAARDAVWRTQVDPIAATLRRAGMTVDRTTFGSEAATSALDAAWAALTEADRVRALAASSAYAKAAAALVSASERLGIAVATVYPHARPISGGDGAHAPPGTLDRVVLDDARSPAPLVVIVEEKGGGSTLGTRVVPDPNSPDTRIRAQQAGPEYVHDLLSSDLRLAAALVDPALGTAVREAVAAGRIRCFVAHTSARGVVTWIEYGLDPGRLRPDTIEWPATEGRRP